MSETKTRLPLFEAYELANEVLQRLKPACERIYIAGSIRRKKPDIGDLELVAVPRVTLVSEVDLFGDTIKESEEDALHLLCSALKLEGILKDRLDKNGRPAYGRRFKRLLYRDVPLDLFAVLEPAQLGVLMAIRTGPADWSHRLVTPCERHAYSRDGRDLGAGWCPPSMYFKDGALWRDGQIVPTPTEQDVFAAIGRDWIEPEERAA